MNEIMVTFSLSIHPIHFIVKHYEGVRDSALWIRGRERKRKFVEWIKALKTN